MSQDEQLRKVIENFKGSWIILPFDKMSDEAQAEIARMVVVKDSLYQQPERVITVNR